MFKKALFAMVPMMLLACSIQADDDLLTALAKIDTDNDTAAAVESGDHQLGQADVDALLGDDEETSSDAIAACFRRYGNSYGNYGNSYGSYGGYQSYGNQPYSNWYSPRYTSYPTYGHCYTPTYTYCTPCYSYYTPCYTSYWGCH